MESSEDDAGTATNASRRTSAREKDVGLAEDVNATSSFHQKTSEARMSCQTPAISEDNFDGDSVPSPSSQDVNTSTEAILDMIDEIVDGPGAPKRLYQTSEVVDALNEEFATTSYNLNIIQEVTNSDSENITPLVQEVPVSNAYSGTTVSAETTPAGCSSPNNKPIGQVITDSESVLSVSTSESSDTVVLLDSVPKGDNETSSSCQLQNIPSSSEVQTVKSVCGSACEPQDRTMKCVTSSDNRDNVTVESAESTSSDSSLSERKALHTEPQTWSPLRRRLVRPVQSDRRPDYTVSSTVDSQTVNIPATGHTSCENIKDVTSSSDAVVSVLSNVKPEEISNISEIKFCQAEPSVSPPKKIKLIRQKIITGTSNREVAGDQMSVLPDKEPCQSTSNDNHLINLPIPPTESSKNLPILSEPQECSDKQMVNDVSHNLPRSPVESGHSVCSVEHSQQITELHKSSDSKSCNKQTDVEQPYHDQLDLLPINTSESSSSDKHPCTLEQGSSPPRNSPNHIINVNMNYLEQGKVYNTYDNENRELDYIPLCLPQKSKECHSKSIKDQSFVTEIDSKKTNEVDSITESRTSKELPSNELESKTTAFDSKTTPELQSSELVSSCNNPQLNTLELPLETANLQSKFIKQESKPSEVGSICNKTEPKLKENNESELENSETLLTKKEPVSKNLESEMKNAELELRNSNSQSKISKVQSKDPDTDCTNNKPDSSSCEIFSSSSDSKQTNSEIACKNSAVISDNSEQGNDSSSKSKSAELISSMSSASSTCGSCIPTPPINCESSDNINEQDLKKVPPIKLNLSRSLSNQSEVKSETEHSSIIKNNITLEDPDSNKVPKLTIKLKQPEEPKSPIPKVTIKPLRQPVEQDEHKIDNVQQVRSVTKLNIKPILKPVENVNDKQSKSHSESDNKDVKENITKQLPFVTKLNIKQVNKPPEKINVIHRKSSSSEISESEYSENDETTSTSDQASVSDNGSSDVVPKVTIKMGKPGTESEGKFYTEKNVPKLTIKGIQQDEKVIISQSQDIPHEKIPKLTIKTVNKTECQPLSPKLTIKPLKPPDSPKKEPEIPKMKISSESFSPTEGKEGPHVPKITIKAVTRVDLDTRAPKKSSGMCDISENVPVVTKLNIKPILKPTVSGEPSQDLDDKVPVVSKLNIKPLIKPKDNDVNSSIDDIPKITKLNIKPLKNLEENSSEHFKDCDDLNADIDKNSIPVITKLNIKPIIKPQEDKKEKDSENLSSETGNSSDDNTDIPVITKLNIKPIVKPDELQELSKQVMCNEQNIPIVTKLNIKPLVKPREGSPSSPKKEHLKVDIHSTSIPVVTKINIKPILRPEEAEASKSKDDSEDKSSKNPPLVMKINMKSVADNINHDSSDNKNVSNYVGDADSIPHTKMPNEIEKSPDSKGYRNLESETVNDHLDLKIGSHSSVEKSLKQNCIIDPIQKNEDYTERTLVNKKVHLKSFSKTKCDISATQQSSKPTPTTIIRSDSVQMGSSVHDSNTTKEDKDTALNETSEFKNINFRSAEITESNSKQAPGSQKASNIQNCTLLKKLLENTKDNLDKKLEKGNINCTLSFERSESMLMSCKNIKNDHSVESVKSSSDQRSETTPKSIEDKFEDSSDLEKVNDHNKSEGSILLQELKEKVNESVTKPLEIAISDKLINQGSDQDSPRIILKINKTDHGSSAKIITEDMKRADTLQNYVDNIKDNLKDKPSPRKQVTNSRRKPTSDTTAPQLSLSTGKRLRSSRIVENTEKLQLKKNIVKRPSPPENSPPQSKEPELSILQTKRLKLGQFLSGNNVVTNPLQTSPTKTLDSKAIEAKPAIKTVNHSLLSNENCSKNGNSKLHNILSNLQAKQMQSLGLINTNCTDKVPSVSSDIDCNASISSSDLVDVPPMENSHPELQEMIINENSDFRDLTGPEDTSQDPLEVPSLKPAEVTPEVIDIPKPVELTPQPKKRGRPRKLPVSEGAKPAVVTLPVPALEERPQRSLRLMRDRPTIVHKPRGRGRGRGARRLPESSLTLESNPFTLMDLEQTDVRPPGEIDPMSSRIKLPRMTEALDKMPSLCMTPLSSRRRSSSENFSTGDTSDLKVILDSTPGNEFPNTPELSGPVRRGRGRGSRGGRGRTPRGRGRGRGGGRGAMYMKETMGIYGRVCGPATTTVQLFEEETCMMDDNATPTNSRPSHLLDDDSQSSVKSSTNESSKMKKSKFADLFDSNKVWTAADVKEYTWPPTEKQDAEPTVMMIQEQIAMFLGVKSFKRRYPELKRRTIGGEERDYVLSKGLVTEALCDLGITAVDASDVLDIMLSDYPHKYEEFRSHQRQRQLTEVLDETVEESKLEEKVKVEVKLDKNVEQKPDLPKVDPEKTRQDMAAAAIASASEWNARANAARRGACADLQSFTVLRPRAPPVAPARPHLRPPAGFYPHALLPGQYQHSYRLYTPEQLRYFPLNTVLGAPPAPPSVTESSSDSEPDWGSRCSSSDDSDVVTHPSAKRKKLSKVKRVSQVEATTSSVKEEPRDEVVDTCRVCKLRLEANRKYTHERFLVCANCNAKLHPGCVELNADTIRKCREYPWQCAECKTCCSCRQPADDDKMLFCDLCDRGFHIYCVGLETVPSGRWHCVECAICKSCGARSPSGNEAGASTSVVPGSGGGVGPGSSAAAPPADWHHQTKRGPGGHKVYSHSLCTPCARVR